MIVDSIWRTVPYLLLAIGIWLLVVGLVMLLRSVEGTLTVWFWLRLVAAGAACYGSCLWIHTRHDSAKDWY